MPGLDTTWLLRVWEGGRPNHGATQRLTQRLTEVGKQPTNRHSEDQRQEHETPPSGRVTVPPNPTRSKLWVHTYHTICLQGLRAILSLIVNRPRGRYGDDEVTGTLPLQEETADDFSAFSSVCVHHRVTLYTLAP